MNAQFKKEYLSAMHCKKAINDIAKSWEMPTIVVVSILNGRNKWDTSNEVETFFGEKTFGVQNSVVQHMQDMVEQVRDYRLMATAQTSSNNYNPIKKHEHLSSLEAGHVLLNQYKRCLGLRVLEGNAKEPYVEHEKTSDYSGHNYVGLKLTWHHTVFSKGLAMLMSGSGKRFVMHAKRVDFDALPETATAFKVKTVTWKKSVPDIQIGWLVVHNHDGTELLSEEGETKKVHAYATNLQSAIQLLNRRTKAFVLDTLLDNL
jgi:hypothetical protein